MMKRNSLTISALALISLLALSGCGDNSNKTKASATTESKITATTTTKDSTSASTKDSSTKESSTKDSTKASTNSSQSSSSSQATTEKANTQNETPYAVDLAQLASSLTFNLKGVNVPKTITLSNNDTPTVTFPTNQTYSTTIDTVPTKVIRLFSYQDNGIRSVKVNTRITLNQQTSGSTGQHINEVLYLFANAQGGLSLATPNYAGNVPDNQTDVMLEAVQ